MTFTFDQIIQLIGLASSTGVLAGGVGLFKWGLSVERRVMKLELTTGSKA